MNKLTVTRVDDVRNPQREAYRRYIDVYFSNDSKVRHVVENNGQYLEQAFIPDDHDTVYDDHVVVRDGFDPTDLDEYVTTWLDVTLDEARNKNTSTWPLNVLTRTEQASPTNVRYE